MVSDYTVKLPQLLFGENKVEELITELEGWLEDSKEIGIDLIGEGDQQLEIYIGKDSRLISTIDKPAFVLSYSAGSFRNGEWAFVVDQSCIQILQTSMRDALHPN